MRWNAEGASLDGNSEIDLRMPKLASRRRPAPKAVRERPVETTNRARWPNAISALGNAPDKKFIPTRVSS